MDRKSIARLRAFLFAGGTQKANWTVVVALVVVALVVGALLAFLTPVGGIVVLVAGAGVLLMLRDVRWGLFALLAVVCLLPFASLPFKFIFTPTFLDLVFAVLYAVWGMRLITRTQDDFVLTPVGLPALVFIVLALFSFVIGLSHTRPSMNDVRTFAEVLMGFALFFLVVNNVRGESVLRQLTAVAILAGAAEAAIGVLFFVLPRLWTVSLLNPLGRLGYPVGLGALRFVNDDPAGQMRAIGTSVDPNILGALLVIVIPIAVAQLFTRRPVLPRAWLALSVGLMWLCLFLTYSRSSMVGAIAAVGVIALLRYRRLLIILLLLGALALLLPQTREYIAYFLRGVRIEDLSTQMRMGEYRDTLKLIQRYPWVGVGFVGTPDLDLYLAVASIYLTLLGQMGIVGLMAFLLVMAAFLLYLSGAWRSLPVGGSPEPFLLGFGAAVLGSLISGVADHTLLTYPHAVALLWLTLGLGAAAARMAFARFHASFTQK